MPRPDTTRAPGTFAEPSRDAALAHAIETWFAANARDLPWRRVVGSSDGIPLRDPYHSLVSELMLQQTQVSRVIERFSLFIARFPTVHDLARAPVDDVLALWSGLGYYRRARLLHAAARHVVDHLAGEFPRDPAALRSIPGVGPYTAGAVASMALGQRAPLVDGNVARVLLRLELPPVADRPHADPRAHAWAWDRAAELVSAARIPGRFNEGMMELGALVCTPAAPRCLHCPVRDLCRARDAGRQDDVPAPKVRANRTTIHASAVLLHDSDARVALQQRPQGGMWAGLWQAPTLERPDRFATSAELRAWLARELDGPLPARTTLRRIAAFTHTTTHREVQFHVWTTRGTPAHLPPAWKWASPADLPGLALSSAQARVLASMEGRGKAAAAAPAPDAR